MDNLKYSDLEYINFDNFKYVTKLYKPDNGRYWFYLDDIKFEYQDYFVALAEHTAATCAFNNHLKRNKQKGSKE